MDLQLSDAQKGVFAGWRRPLEASDPGEQRRGDEASLMTAAHDLDLIQDITTDCSVVASLCAGAARANRGHPNVFLLASVRALLSYD